MPPSEEEVEARKMTPRQVELARHALGLPNSRRQSYRNHYVVDSGADFDAWQELVAAGMARSRKGNELTGGMTLFWLTKDGATAALKKGERLDPEDFPEAAKVRESKT